MSQPDSFVQLRNIKSLQHLCMKKIVDVTEYDNLESLIGIIPRSLVDEILDTIESNHQVTLNFDIDYEDDVYLQLNI